jgi:hypothetical protein
MKLGRLALVLAALALLAAGASAQDLDASLEAAEAGDFEAAFQEWRPLAEQGNADAQVSLDLPYDRGTAFLRITPSPECGSILPPPMLLMPPCGRQRLVIATIWRQG